MKAPMNATITAGSPRAVMGRSDYNPEHPERFIWSTIESLALAASAVDISRAITNNLYPELLGGLRAALNIIAIRAKK